MKTVITFSLLLLLFFSSNAQEITKLEEAKIFVEFPEFHSPSNPNHFTFFVKENYRGEFEEDPLRFLITNIDFPYLIKQKAIHSNEFYNVTLRSKKGFLEARYSSQGKILETFQKFENIVLPAQMRHDLFKYYKGWTMTSNKVKARGIGEKIEYTIYRLELKKGNEKKKLKISGNQLDPVIASR